MFSCYPAASVGNGDFGICRSRRDRDSNHSTAGSETQCIIDEIADGSAEQHRIGIDFTFAFGNYRNMSLFGDGLIVVRDFFYGRSGVKQCSLDLPISRFSAGEEEKIIDNAG